MEVNDKGQVYSNRLLILQKNIRLFGFFLVNNMQTWYHFNEDVRKKWTPADSCQNLAN